MIGLAGGDCVPQVDPDETHMARALELAEAVRDTTTHPTQGFGAVVSPGGTTFEGATEPPGGRHAEVIALESAAAAGGASGATMYTTLEPCSHTGRTPPCVGAVLGAGVARVVVGMLDPDPRVRGSGAAALEAAGIDVEVGVGASAVAEQLAPYVKHRRTGRPWVVLKLAATLDGRIAAADGSSRWITGEEARRDAHRLRAFSDAVVVGAGTVRSDDPELTVRLGKPVGRQPLRVVLGSIPEGARVHPAIEHRGELGPLLEELGRRGVLQVLVEGGARVAGAFHRAGLVDRYVLYLAPSFAGGDDARPMFSGPGAATVEQLFRGSLVSVERVGEDLRVEVAA